MQAFWAKGYEATSLADLMAATRLHKGSLYQAFGDKHALFLASLKRYLDEMRRSARRALDGGASPLDGLRNLGHAMIEMTDTTGDEPSGCMAINALVELAPHDADVRQILLEHVGHMRAAIEQTVGKAQAAGQIGKDRPAELVAGMLMTFVAGLGTTIKCYIDKQQAHALFDQQLEVLL